jgi:hypothetical protein
MSREAKFLEYLSQLKGTHNASLVECIENGFKTLVEYQVTGNMSERGVDLMEDAEEPSEDKASKLVAYIEKLDAEIAELRRGMQQIDDIADQHDLEHNDTGCGEDCEGCDVCSKSRDSMEEAYALATDGELVAVSGEGLEADVLDATEGSKEMEEGGSLNGREPQKIEDVDPRDIEPVETGQRFVKVEGEDSVHNNSDDNGTDSESNEDEVLPDNVRKGEAAGTSVSDFSDSEGKMANKQLDQIHDQAGKLAGSFEDDEQLKAWVQAKITKAQQTLDVIYEFFREEKKLDEKPEDGEVVEDDTLEQPIFEK